MTLLELQSNRTEDWRWSDLSALHDLSSKTPSGQVPESLPWIDSEGPRLVFVDGVFDESRSCPGEVKVSPAKRLASGQPLADYAADGASTGYRLVLDSSRAASGLLQLLYVSSGGAAHHSNQILLGKGAQASLVETHIGPGWSNSASHFELDEGARLMRALRVLKSGGAHTDFASCAVKQAASYDSLALVTGCDSARIENRIRLLAPGAYGEAGGALLARGSQRLEGFTVIRHSAPGGTSRQLWRSVADDRSTCSVSARVEVDRDAQRTDGEQSLKGILLAPGASVNAKPELEIYADDVKCAHGATVGELDRDALFYLQSRGATPERARGLLTRAFVADALERIGEAKVREVFYEEVERWFAPKSPVEGPGE